MVVVIIIDKINKLIEDNDKILNKAHDKLNCEFDRQLETIIEDPDTVLSKALDILLYILGILAIFEFGYIVGQMT